MTDIVERLRALNADFLHEEAADEIERLRADLLKAEMQTEMAGLENIMRAVARGRREGIEAAAAIAGNWNIPSVDKPRHILALLKEPNHD